MNGEGEMRVLLPSICECGIVRWKKDEIRFTAFIV